MNARIAAGELNYEGIGSTEHGPPPADADCLVTHAFVGEGMATYRRVVQGMLTWQLQKRAGLRVRAESDVVVPGTRVVSGFGVGPFRLNAPCEVGLGAPSGAWRRPAVRRIRLRDTARASGPR